MAYLCAPRSEQPPPTQVSGEPAIPSGRSTARKARLVHGSTTPRHPRWSSHAQGRGQAPGQGGCVGGEAPVGYRPSLSKRVARKPREGGSWGLVGVGGARVGAVVSGGVVGSMIGVGVRYGGVVGAGVFEGSAGGLWGARRPLAMLV